MSYLWQVEVDGQKIVIKAIRAHTAIAYAVKYLALNSRNVHVTCVRGRKLKKVHCDFCGRNYDDDNEKCPSTLYHETKEVKA